jgi:hypothetical protein
VATNAINHAIINIGAQGEVRRIARSTSIVVLNRNFLFFFFFFFFFFLQQLGLQSSHRSYPDMGALVNAHKKTLQSPLARDVGFSIGVPPGVGHAPPAPPGVASTIISNGPHADDYVAPPHSSQQPAQQPQQVVRPARVPPATIGPPPQQQQQQQQQPKPAPANHSIAVQNPLAAPAAPAPVTVVSATPDNAEQDMETSNDDDDPLQLLAALADDNANAAMHEPPMPAAPLPPEEEEDDIGFNSESEEPNGADGGARDQGASGGTPYTTQRSEIALVNPLAGGGAPQPAPAAAATQMPPMGVSGVFATGPIGSPGPTPFSPPPPATEVVSPRAAPADAPPPTAAAPAAESGNMVDDVLQQGLNYLEVTRKQAEDALLRSPPGSYMVRPSSQPLCLALTYVTELAGGRGGQIGHLLLRNQPGIGWTTEGRPTPFRTLRELLESLPYALKLRPLQGNGAAAAANGSTVNSGATAAATAAEAQRLEAERRMLAEQQAMLAQQQAEVERQKRALAEERERLEVQAAAAQAAAELAAAQAAAEQAAAAAAAAAAREAQAQAQAQAQARAASPQSGGASPAGGAGPRVRGPTSPAELDSPVDAMNKRQIRRTVRTQRGLSTTVQKIQNGDQTVAAVIPVCEVCRSQPMEARIVAANGDVRLACKECTIIVTAGSRVSHTQMSPQAAGIKIVHTAPATTNQHR